MTQPGQVMLKEILEIPRMLHDIDLAMQSETEANRLFNTKKFQSVVILARGTSDNAAHFFKYLLETQLGLPVGLASPSAATMYPTKFNYQNTLLIAISQSGQSTDLITFAKAAKQGGGYLLSITNDAKSPLALLSDLHIPIWAGPEIAVPATKSYVGQCMISYLLSMSWSGNTTSCGEIEAAAKDIASDTNSHKQFAAELDLSKPIYILGRGFSYPNAKEFALKLQETCLVPVQGMSSSDFLHGPIASLNPNVQVVFIAPAQLPNASFGEAPDRVRAITGKVFWIGNPRQLVAGDVLFKTPTLSSEITSCIVDAIAFQKVTHQLAVSNGLNPDSPQGLSKVTITR